LLIGLVLPCCAAFLCACGGKDETALSAAASLPTLREPTVLTDTNPDPNIVEVQLVAGLSTTEYLKGKSTQVWAYRDGAQSNSKGTVPGPLLRAKVGDQVIVHFSNELPNDETTIHWHGVRVPPNMDGSMASQAPVMPGAQFDYTFTVTDASSYWYHSHFKADEQVEHGLYAPMVVTGDEVIDVAAERYLLLDDVKLNADGSLNQNIDEMDRMMGRQGNVLLINGQHAPAALKVASGSRERWRIVDAANGRFFNLRIPGLSFLVIGTDGGLLPEPYQTDTLLIAPGERYDVLVTFDAAAKETAVLQTIYYDRGHDIPDPGPQDLLQLDYGTAAAAPAPLPQTWPTLSRLAVDATTTVRPFVLAEFEQPGLPVVFTINDQRWPDNTPVMVKSGDTEIWEVRNDAEMDHPFHLHGMFFQVLPDANGTPPVPDGWKDTVNIPQKSSLRFAVHYDPPGMWMFHCHILEHAELGMMGDLMVMP
jgi:FtsP/CotA-like multicopper oxidase with cupredoxin domain